MADKAKVTRYDPDQDLDGYTRRMIPSESGDFVSADDYDALLARAEAAEAKIDKAEACHLNERSLRNKAEARLADVKTERDEAIADSKVSESLRRKAFEVSSNAIAERDSYRAVLEGAGYGDLDGIGKNGRDKSLILGQKVARLTMAIQAQRNKLREALEELLAAMHPDAGEVDRKLAMKDAQAVIKSIDMPTENEYYSGFDHIRAELDKGRVLSPVFFNSRRTNKNDQ